MTASLKQNSRRILSCYFYSFIELLAVNFKFFNKLIMYWRKDRWLKEVKMAKITSKEKVLHIGCGILPTESILIAENEKVKVVSIDNSHNAVKLAKKYVKKRNLSNLITIEYGDGSSYPVDKFNVVFVAINVWPIDSVILHLSKHLKKGAKVVCKSRKNDIVNVLNDLELDGVFNIEEKIQHPETQAFLLIKKQ
jgi:protein-L-isoaspartate O-methyltransferase